MMTAAFPRAVPAAAGEAPDARWGDAVRLTGGLWSFVLLLYLPQIVTRHDGQPLSSIVLDSGTILISMLLGLALFLPFRATVRLPMAARLPLLVLAVMTMAVLQTAFDHVFTEWVTANIESAWASLPRSLKRGYGVALTYAGVFAVNLALFQLAHSHRRTRAQEARLAELTAAAQRTELDHFRLRLNPHFLFNTLNGLSAMVVTGRVDEADELIGRLASFLRATIASDPGALVSLDEEFALTERYLAIEEARFAERLRIGMDDAAEVGAACLPALTVQPLVEVALRDGLASATRWIRVKLGAVREAETLRIDLACCFRRTDPLDREARETIANLRRRLQALYGERAGLDIRTERCGFGATMRLPLSGGCGA